MRRAHLMLLAAMAHSTRLFSILATLVLAGCASPFPIKDEQGAIAIAKQVCISRVATEWYRGAPVWKAILWDNHWQVSGTPANESSRPNGGNIVIDIPVDGPAPKDCNISFSDGI